MGFLSPMSDVQNVYGAIQEAQQAYAAWQDAAARAASSGKAPPPAPPHPEEVMQQLRTQSEFNPENPSSNDGYMGRIGNPDPIPAPWRGEFDMPGNFERRQHMANSMANDARLREELGSSRRRTKEDGPDGTYALANYPGLEHAINVAASGVDVRGGLMTPESVAERKRWAAEQGRRLGLDRRIGLDEWRGFRGAMKGRGAKQRRAAMKSFMRGV